MYFLEPSRFKKSFYIHKFIFKSFFLYRSYYYNTYTNIANVETCVIPIFNCAWKKATTEHNRQYELQLDNNLKQLRYDDHTKIGHIKLEYF